MTLKRIAATLVPLFIALSGAAFAADAPRKAATLSEALPVLHAVSEWAVDLSSMAATKAKSDLVKDFASEVATANSERDAKLQELAKKHNIELGPVDPKTEEGKSMLDRMKAEKEMLSSLEGDAFDKEYMTLVTNTQQSVVNVLESQKAAAKDPDVKKFLTEMTNAVQKRLKKAQDIMIKVYGDRV